METIKTSVFDILSLSTQEVLQRVPDIQPRDSIFSAKLKLLYGYLSSHQLYRDSEEILNDEIFKDIALYSKNPVEQSTEFLAEVGAGDLVLERDLYPLLQYTLIKDEELTWRYFISNLAPKNLVSLISSSLMHQELFTTTTIIET